MPRNVPDTHQQMVLNLKRKRKQLAHGVLKQLYLHPMKNAYDLLWTQVLKVTQDCYGNPQKYIDFDYVNTQSPFEDERFPNECYATTPHNVYKYGGPTHYFNTP